MRVRNVDMCPVRARPGAKKGCIMRDDVIPLLSAVRGRVRPGMFAKRPSKRSTTVRTLSN
jgi:hypothetical protein